MEGHLRRHIDIDGMVTYNALIMVLHAIMYMDCQKGLECVNREIPLSVSSISADSSWRLLMPCLSSKLVVIAHTCCVRLRRFRWILM